MEGRPRVPVPGKCICFLGKSRPGAPAAEAHGRVFSWPVKAFCACEICGNDCTLEGGDYLSAGKMHRFVVNRRGGPPTAFYQRTLPSVEGKILPRRFAVRPPNAVARFAFSKTFSFSNVDHCWANRSLRKMKTFSWAPDQSVGPPSRPGPSVAARCKKTDLRSRSNARGLGPSTGTPDV